ncbi:MAG TPA: hypothetical protein VJI46_02125 [Candidatus Nanoarchaeia archaeon]|nr:hypothetical protein [Candidatus Nanoarchaeia archaeon]
MDHNKEIARVYTIAEELRKYASELEGEEIKPEFGVFFHELEAILKCSKIKEAPEQMSAGEYLAYRGIVKRLEAYLMLNAEVPCDQSAFVSVLKDQILKEQH